MDNNNSGDARAPLPDMGAVLAGGRAPHEKEIRRRESAGSPVRESAAGTE